MIEADFTLTRGEFRLDANFHDGGVVLLSGENGSGKSTFLYALAGFIPVESGMIKLNGKDVTNLEVQERGIVHLTPNSYISNLSVDRHITWPDKPGFNPEWVGELKESFGISFHGKVGHLSMGQRIRVSLATAFHRKPQAVLIDEALSNLSDPLDVYDEIRRLSSEHGLDVIVVAHSLPGLRADSSYTMVNGSMKRTY